MKENNLLASVALFSELYDNKKDIYDVIGEFIKAAVISEPKLTFTTTDATFLLEKNFEFKIPESVVKTTLKNRLDRSGAVTFNNGQYSISQTELQKENQFPSEFEKRKNNYHAIVESLISYLETKESKLLTEKEKAELNENFNAYLLDNGVDDKYSQYISSFIIENQGKENFTEDLNACSNPLLIGQNFENSFVIGVDI